MERVSRFTRAEIVKSIDGLVSKTALGFCNLFKLQNFVLSDGEWVRLSEFYAWGTIQVLCNAFFLEIRHPPTPRNANNVEPYIFFHDILHPPTPYCIT